MSIVSRMLFASASKSSDSWIAIEIVKNFNMENAAKMIGLVIQPSHAIRQQQLQYAAERVFDTVLLTTGYPTYWNETVPPTILGLALPNTKTPYVLDEKKVNGLQYISFPDDVPSALKLGNEYGFDITFEPAFEVTIDDNGGGVFDITVRSRQGYPLSGAEITGYYVPDTWIAGVFSYVPEETITDWNGLGTLDFGYSSDVLAVLVNYHGVKVMRKVGTLQNGYIRFEGNYITQSDYPIMEDPISYSTGGGVFSKVTLYRHVSINDFTYYVIFTFWRLFD